MKLVEINKMSEGKADVGIIIAGTLKKYEIGYSTAVASQYCQNNSF